MKKFLIIQLRPEDETADNEFEAFLKYGKLKLEEVERLHLDRTHLAGGGRKNAGAAGDPGKIRGTVPRALMRIVLVQ